MHNGLFPLVTDKSTVLQLLCQCRFGDSAPLLEHAKQAGCDAGEVEVKVVVVPAPGNAAGGVPTAGAPVTQGMLQGMLAVSMRPLQRNLTDVVYTASQCPACRPWHKLHGLLAWLCCRVRSYPNLESKFHFSGRMSVHGFKKCLGTPGSRCLGMFCLGCGCTLRAMWLKVTEEEAASEFAEQAKEEEAAK